jgi:hypothetical protein
MIKYLIDSEAREDLATITHKILTDLILNTVMPWAAGALSGGSSTAVDSEDKHPGIYDIKNTTSANSGFRYYTGNIAVLRGLEKTTFIFKTPASISATSVIRLGFQNSINNNAPSNGVYINIANTTLDGRTVKDNTASTTATSYTISAGTWYRMTIEINTDATLITFKLYADNSDTVLWSNTLAANIPTAVLTHSLVAYDTGVTAITLGYLDYMDIVFTNSRKV